MALGRLRQWPYEIYVHTFKQDVYDGNQDGLQWWQMFCTLAAIPGQWKWSWTFSKGLGDPQQVGMSHVHDNVHLRPASDQHVPKLPPLMATTIQQHFFT